MTMMRSVPKMTEIPITLPTAERCSEVFAINGATIRAYRSKMYLTVEEQVVYFQTFTIAVPNRDTFNEIERAFKVIAKAEEAGIVRVDVFGDEHDVPIND